MSRWELISAQNFEFALKLELLLQNNKIYDAVKCFDWTRFPKNETQIYQIFLMHVQQPQIIYIAGVWELNMETCVFVSIC